MATHSGQQHVVVTGHNRESASRVIHYIRPIGGPSAGASMEFHGGLIVTDEAHMLEDGVEGDVMISFQPTAPEPVAPTP